MFEVLKVFAQKTLGLETFIAQVTTLGYLRVDQVLEAGDFSVKGDLVEICPVNFDMPVRIHWEWDRISSIYTFNRQTAKKVSDLTVLMLIASAKNTAYTENTPLESFVDIKEGDYVVHNQFGIGRFLGKKTLKENDRPTLFFDIEYRDKDHLYIPAEKSELIQKYVNFGLKEPRLSKLGSKEWAHLKNKVRTGIRKTALELIRTQAARSIISGFQFSPDTQWQRKFEETFPYELTSCQKKAWEETKKDMETTRAMDRLICGDVGFGKTEIALRAAFKAVMDAKQVAILVPTTLLAYQYYNLLVRRLTAFPIKVEMLSRFRTITEQKDIITELKTGTIDIIVGTHRLLSDDVSFRDLRLLIIDEEQRFGVIQKERIKKISLTVDVITLTATPIPRTLYMSLIDLKGISLIKTPPEQRVQVKTSIEVFNKDLIQSVICREKQRQGQVFFIHNRIDDIHNLERQLREILPKNISIAVAHGQLPPKSIEHIMFDFIQGKTDCLLSTVIIESGIDIPNANTIIVNNAHTFGLADLHQLRGRVGRYTKQAYAYFLIPRKSIDEEAQKRLNAIEDFSHLGAGFQIAMRDLELRGAGNILGENQHGFVSSIGLDLYCRILKEEIEQIRRVVKLSGLKSEASS